MEGSHILSMELRSDVHSVGEVKPDLSDHVGERPGQSHSVYLIRVVLVLVKHTSIGCWKRTKCNESVPVELDSTADALESAVAPQVIHLWTTYI